MPTAAERKRIFEEVQARSRAARGRRRGEMSATAGDARKRVMGRVENGSGVQRVNETGNGEKKPTPQVEPKPEQTPQKKMKTGISFIDLLKKRRKQTEGALEYR